MASKKSKLKLQSEIPNITSLEEKFIFVEDQVLRENLSKDFQYLVFLIALTSEMDIDDTNIGSSIRRDMIVHAVSIIEALLFYMLRVAFDHDWVQSRNIMPDEWKYENLNVFYLIPEGEKEVISAIRYKKSHQLTHQTKLDQLNSASKKAGFIEQDLYDEIDKVRKLRNEIHLAGLGELNTVSKEKVDEVFAVAGKTKAVVENAIHSIKTF